MIDGIDVAEKSAAAVVANWWAGVTVADWIGEVRVIECVVRLKAELNIARALQSAKWNVLVDLQVGIIESRTMEEVPFHISKGADWFLRKC